MLSVRIAISGLSTSFFNSSKVLAKDLPSFSFTLMKVGFMLSKTAYRIEHRKEKNIEIKA